MNMDNLIVAVNKLQDVFHEFNLSDSIELPQIVMLGSQSSGKSSVLEAFVGRSFLPRGTGIVTRCPLVLQLIVIKEDDHKYNRFKNGTGQIKEWGEFLHCKDRYFTDFDDIRKEIEDQTDRLAGENKGICEKAINLKFYIAKGVNLTLVDLPGITKVAVGDQPMNIEEQIKKLIIKYIENPKSIILSVSAANADLATSESLKFAKDVDPDGRRTLAVLTKIDIMDPGTDAWDMLNGKLIPVKLGIVGVVNRSQKDINSNKTIHDQLKNEKEFFQKNYKKIAHKNGIDYLANKLSKLLMNHIYEHLPKLRQEISAKRDEFQKILDACGEEITDRETIFIKIITSLTQKFCGLVDGSLLHRNNADVIGGPKMRKIFDENFNKSLESIVPECSKQDITNSIKDFGGPRTTIFAPEVLFQNLVRLQIERLREPSIGCLLYINIEMNAVIKECVADHVEFKRFPNLLSKVQSIFSKFLNERIPETRKAINTQIDIELSSFNPNHPNFTIYESIVKNNSKKDEIHAEAIEKLIKSYFPIVKMTIQDLVPKIIMHFLIIHMKNNLQERLLSDLLKEKEDLLSESESNVQRREEAKSMLNALKIADDKIDKVNITPL